MLDDVFIAQFGFASSARRVLELAVEDFLEQATISTMGAAQPAQTSLPHATLRRNLVSQYLKCAGYIKQNRAQRTNR